MWISKRRFKEIDHEAAQHRLYLWSKKMDNLSDPRTEVRNEGKILKLMAENSVANKKLADAIIFPDKVSFSKIDPGTKAQFLNNHPDKDIISGEKCAVVMMAREPIWYIVERNGRLETWEAKELRIIEPPKKKGKKR